ncbi:hypothetical protein CO153_02925 [Candidatus Pacearchaeota archaeon CG_4_9_14_3_um_filter_30_11]|nr:MAG: hypothetical protein CO153_02925 [Candidatus Pacearchaeota archaeon CG_4_9_14_3_um_filter_30_11]
MDYKMKTKIKNMVKLEGESWNFWNIGNLNSFIFSPPAHPEEQFRENYHNKNLTLISFGKSHENMEKMPFSKKSVAFFMANSWHENYKEFWRKSI